jgi:hypothetical protein
VITGSQVMKSYFGGICMVCYYVTTWNMLARGAKGWSATALRGRGGGTVVSWPHDMRRAATVASTIVEKEEPVVYIAKLDGSLASSDTLGAATKSIVLADHADFITPERDPRKYRAIKLPNNLQVLLVCDEMTSGVGVEAASVHVQAGHFDDTIPGLARTSNGNQKGARRRRRN